MCPLELLGAVGGLGVVFSGGVARVGRFLRGFGSYLVLFSGSVLAEAVCRLFTAPVSVRLFTRR